MPRNKMRSFYKTFILEALQLHGELTIKDLTFLLKQTKRQYWQSGGLNSHREHLTKFMMELKKEGLVKYRLQRGGRQRGRKIWYLVPILLL